LRDVTEERKVGEGEEVSEVPNQAGREGGRTGSDQNKKDKAEGATNRREGGHTEGRQEG